MTTRPIFLNQQPQPFGHQPTIQWLEKMRMPARPGNWVSVKPGWLRVTRNIMDQLGQGPLAFARIGWDGTAIYIDFVDEPGPNVWRIRDGQANVAALNFLPEDRLGRYPAEIISPTMLRIDLTQQPS